MQAPPERVDTYRIYFRSASRAAVWLPQRPPQPLANGVRLSLDLAEERHTTVRLGQRA